VPFKGRAARFGLSDIDSHHAIGLPKHPQKSWRGIPQIARYYPARIVVTTTAILGELAAAA